MKFSMQETRLQLFNLEGFIKQINSSLKNKDGAINLGEFESKRVKRNPLFYRLNGKEIETRGEYPLTQKGDGRGMGGILNRDSKVKMGYVFVETGFVDANDSGRERYELLELRIKHPIELANGNRIPNCKINLARGAYEWAKPSLEREDCVKYLGLISVRDDLSRVLPSEWFLN